MKKTYGKDAFWFIKTSVSEAHTVFLAVRL